MRLERRAALVAGLIAEGVLCVYPPMSFTMTFDDGLSAGRTMHMFLFGEHSGAWRIDLGRFTLLALLIGVVTMLAWLLWPMRLGRRDTSSAAERVHATAAVRRRSGDRPGVARHATTR